MDRKHLDQQLVNEWRARVGSSAEATRLVVEAIKCGYSKGDKIARGCYPYRLSPLELEELHKLMARPPEGVGTTRKRKGA